MKKTISKVLLFLVLLMSNLYAQNTNVYRDKAMASIKNSTNIENLKKMVQDYEKVYLRNKKEVDKWLKKAKMKKYAYLKDGTVLWIKEIKNGYPVIYSTRNVTAAITTSTNIVQLGGSSNLNLYGSYLGGMDLGIWDTGIPNNQHEAFVDQYNNHHLVIADTASNLTIEDHATHIAGTLIGDNSISSAKGMAWGAILRAWDCKNDLSEISYATTYSDSYTPYLTISNHSYGPDLGWVKGLREDDSNWYWSYDENYFQDPRFGDYDTTAERIDWLALNAQMYLMVRAVGNERGTGPTEFHDNYFYWDNFDSTWKSQLYTGQHPKDGDDDGYGCLPNDAVAKNILTVGAIDDIQNGYTSPADVKQDGTSFSNWGPTLDGRIKPDIVANGEELYSAVYHNPANKNQTGNNYYNTESGTSMASPNACGSILLLQEHYLKTHDNIYPLATTLKALVINSVNAAGVSKGPDYKYGWGLLNTAGAADIITEDASEGVNIQELRINNGQPVQFDVYSDGTSPIYSTIVWNDPTPSNNNVLVHDLDLRITDEDSNTYLPFVLDPSTPIADATTGDDTKNNVEKIIIDNPTFGKYIVKISSKDSYSQNFSIVVSNVTAQPQNMQLTVKQFFEDRTTEIDSIARYENSNFVNYPTGYVFTHVSNQIPVTLRATLKTLTDNQATKEKFHDWNENINYINHSDFNLMEANNIAESYLGKTYNSSIQFSVENASEQNGSIQFKDPWYRDDYSDPKGVINRGLNPIWHSHPSPFNISTSSEYQGVFLGQNSQFNPSLPVYSVKTTSPQKIYVQGKNRSFYFQNWEAEPAGSATFQNENALETPVVFNTEGATVKAVMKGEQLSNSTTGFSGNGQTKAIRTSDDNLYMVYESLNSVWLERSTNNGISWEILNDGKPLNDFYYAKSPSIALDYECPNNFYVTFQEYTEGGSDGRIKLQYYKITPTSVTVLEDEVPTSTVVFNSTSNDMNPVIIKNAFERFIIVWQVVDPLPPYTPGLYYKYGKHRHNDEEFIWYGSSSSQLIAGTNQYSTNPTLAIEDDDQYAEFNLAWCQLGTQIQYYDLNQINNQTEISPSNFTVISTGSGYTSNYSPSIINRDGVLTVNWVGNRKIISGGAEKTTAATDITWEYKSVKRDRYANGSWSYFVKVGDDVNSTNINRIDNNNYAIAWSEGTTNNNYAVHNWAMNSPQNLGIQGRDIQLNNAPAFDEMFAISLNTTTQPYAFNVSDELESYLYKSSSYQIGRGREGVAVKNNAEFYFVLGDVALEGETVEFREIEDTVLINDLTTVNLYLETQPINVNDNSELTYSVMYGFVDSLAVANALSDSGYIRFSLRLVDSESSEIIGNYDAVEYTKENMYLFSNISYNVDFVGIGARSVKLQLKVESNITDECNLSDIYSEGSVLGKGMIRELSFDGGLPLKDYSLSQNYPNPFNPSTIIKYQLPKDCNVKLIVYDVLGREVATLINSFKPKGKYEVEFDGSQLSSGVYVYRIETGDFSQSKKMLMLK